MHFKDIKTFYGRAEVYIMIDRKDIKEFKVVVHTYNKHDTLTGITTIFNSYTELEAETRCRSKYKHIKNLIMYNAINIKI